MSSTYSFWGFVPNRDCGDIGGARVWCKPTILGSGGNMIQCLDGLDGFPEVSVPVSVRIITGQRPGNPTENLGTFLVAGCSL